jgi:hypothetical protein
MSATISIPQVMMPSVLPISSGGGSGSGVLVGRSLVGDGVEVSWAWVDVADGGAVAVAGIRVGVRVGVSEVAA